MSEDYYSSWLGIPPGSRPPDYYTLLGVSMFCRDLHRIDKAARARLGQLDDHCVHPQAQVRDARDRMINEVAQARATLADEDRRRAYERQLAVERGITAPEDFVAPVSVPAPPLPPKPVPVSPRRLVSGREPKGAAPAPAVQTTSCMPAGKPKEGTAAPRAPRTGRWVVPAAIDALALALIPIAMIIRTVAGSPPGSQLRSATSPGATQPSVAARTTVPPYENRVVVDLGNGVAMKLVFIPDGTFTMGSPPPEAGRSRDENQHEVTISRPFYLGVTEVTQKQYETVMGRNPSNFAGDDLPVENVSWDDAVAFCQNLSKKEGKVFRLPTEAEWEYVCRAGSSGPYGDTGNDMGWCSSNSGGKTHPVGQKKPNAWGLYDMHGNVWEWCGTWYDEKYPSGPVTDPVGPASGTSRVLRGGSWSSLPLFCRSDARYRNAPGDRSIGVGFRVCMACPDNPLLPASLPYVPSVSVADARIADLLAKAKANDSKEKGLEALADLAELLKLAPIHAEARALQAKVAGHYARSNTMGMEFALVPPGTFMMGSPLSEAERLSDENQHEVTISKPFYLGVTEVTQKQYRAVMARNPSSGRTGDDLPVENVTWDDAMAFCQNLSKKEGRTYRLPTEAEWEYACRAGTMTPFNTGNTISTDEANYQGGYAYGSGRTGESRWKTMPVGSFKPNAWGLHDMHGNVGEWCADWYANKYPSGPATNPTGPSSGKSRVWRGGSQFHLPQFCRSASRHNAPPAIRMGTGGFRVCLDFPE